jgi:hypothetical protein
LSRTFSSWSAMVWELDMAGMVCGSPLELRVGVDGVPMQI